MSNIVERLKSRAAPLTRARELSPTAELCRDAAERIEALETAIGILQYAQQIAADARYSNEAVGIAFRAALALEQDK